MKQNKGNMMKKLDYTKAIQIAGGIYWVGYNIKDTWFHSNSYLVTDGDECVLIDPGSVVDYEKVHTKVSSIINTKKIRHIILHHQDPDLCSSTVLFEKNNALTVYMPERSSVFARFYGIKSFVVPIANDGEYLEFKSGRRLYFYETPYCHAPGAMVTYDEKNKVLFSSDIFGAFNKNWELYADMIGYQKHLDSVKRFMEPYMPSKMAISSCVRKMRNLDIQMICPQHGSILRKDINLWLKGLLRMKYGKALLGKGHGL